jgi:hypothetical protein
MRDTSLDQVKYAPTVVYTTATFRQHFGETLKDAWGRINKIHKEEPHLCREENMHFYFYYGLEPWYKNALHIATGGSFILSSPKESSRALKNIFGNHDKTTREVDDITTLVATTKEIIEKCARRLPNKYNL